MAFLPWKGNSEIKMASKTRQTLLNNSRQHPATQPVTLRHHSEWFPPIARLQPGNEVWVFQIPMIP